MTPADSVPLNKRGRAPRTEAPWHETGWAQVRRCAMARPPHRTCGGRPATGDCVCWRWHGNDVIVRKHGTSASGAPPRCPSSQASISSSAAGQHAGVIGTHTSADRRGPPVTCLSARRGGTVGHHSRYVIDACSTKSRSGLSSDPSERAITSCNHAASAFEDFRISGPGVAICSSRHARISEGVAADQSPASPDSAS